MAERPLEYELMMSSYTQIGQEFADEVSHLDAFVPSGVEERELGFDIQIPYLKGVAFQYKRPKDSSPRRFSVRYSGQDPPRQLDRMKNWALKFGSKAAFYALPLIVDHSSLSNTLNRTAFVPASKIDPFASIIRVPEDYIQKGERRGRDAVEVYCSNPEDISNNWSSSIQPSDVLGWKGLKTEIEACTAGFRIRWDGESCFDRYHDDHEWYPRQDEFLPNVDLKVASTSDQFVEAYSPLLTRIGNSSSFG